VSPLYSRKARGLRTMRGSRQTVLLARRAPTINGRNGTRVDLLLPERARSECARSTAAVRPDTGTVPDKGKRASLEGTVLSLDARSEEQSAPIPLFVPRAGGRPGCGYHPLPPPVPVRPASEASEVPTEAALASPPILTLLNSFVGMPKIRSANPPEK
jgi:hypothetical protein